MNALLQCLTVGVSGFFGAIARYGLGSLAGQLLPGKPWIGTALINITGSFLLGYFLSAYGDRFPIGHPTRLAIATGFLGAYTTFSTFTFEADGLLRSGQHVTFTLYLVGSVVLGLLACTAGVALGR